MSAASEPAGARSAEDTDRNLALLSYGLLFFAVFFAGAPALIAVAIAYARRGHSSGPVRSHFRYQILVFWVAFATTLAAALCALAALFSLLGVMIRGAIDGRWDSLDTALFSQAHIGAAMAFVTVAAVLAVLSGLWLMAMSAYGFVLLASRQSIRHTAG